MTVAPTSYIIAGSLRHAWSSAVVDWGWCQIGEREFKLPDGTVARYVEDSAPASYMGFPRGTVIHVGYMAYSRRDRDGFDFQFKRGHLIEHYPSRTGQESPR